MKKRLLKRAAVFIAPILIRQAKKYWNSRKQAKRAGRVNVSS